MYVVIDHKTLSKANSEILERALISELQPLLETHGLAIEWQAAAPIQDDLQLETPERIDWEAIKSSSSDAILFIEAVRAEYTGNMFGTSLHGATYDLSMWLPDNNDPMWRARIHNSEYKALNGGLEMMGRVTARKIVEQLAQDGIIP